MEFLIPGLLLVGFMAWASTRIKRNAAAAFDAETIENASFTLKKSDGWLSIVEPDAPYEFDAYTKAYGVAPNENIRLGTANVTVAAGDIDSAFAAATAGGEVTEDVREVVNERHYRVVQLGLEEKSVAYHELLKFADADGSVYTFRIKVLAETTDEFRRDIEGMLDSFELT